MTNITHAFEAFARQHGYMNFQKQGHRYCHQELNILLTFWNAAHEWTLDTPCKTATGMRQHGRDAEKTEPLSCAHTTI